MIQFNLLPDVKLQYIKTRHTKRVVSVVSVIAAGSALIILMLLFLSVQVIQKKHLNDISKDIKTEVSKLQNVQDLDKILTIQNQLASLPDLHAKKPIGSRLFSYIQQVTPTKAFISKIDVDFAANTIKIAGTSDTLATANQYADTLKFATYKTATNDRGKPFSSVVTDLSKDEKKATFTIEMNFDPLLFSNLETPVLVVPNIISTRSVTEKPSAVFKAAEPVTQTPKPGGN